MKYFISTALLFLGLLNTSSGQSFQEMNITGLTTTPSASRSANFVDVNGDGWDDVYFSNGPSGGQKNMMYINNQNGTFTTVTTDDIVTQLGRSDGVSFADVDNDGDLDCFEVTYGFGGIGNKNYFYRNNGNGTFTYEPAIAMGSVLTYSEMANWIDINNDQFLDLYITNSNGSTKNLYYENQGNGSFLSVTNLSITSENLKSRSINWIDYDNDGDNDLFITNEQNSNNSLFRNDGPNNFTKITGLSIVQDGNSTAGSSWADVDNDGDMDLFIANFENENNKLYLNNAGVFTEQTSSVIALGVGFSFGSAFGDMDNDGDLDLFVCNAYLNGQIKNYVYINDGNGVFSEDTSSTLANHIGYTFGCAFGDYDNDGWLDIILANTQNENQANSLFRNTGSGNNWIKILCKGTPSNRSAVGAKVKVKATLNGNVIWQTRQIEAAAGYCSQNSFTNHFGLANAAIVDEIRIEWPSGNVETFNIINPNEFYVIEEGNGILSVDNAGIKFPEVSIYPNPASQEVTLKINDATNAKILVELYDMQSKKVFSTNMNSNDTVQIKRNGLAAGEYVLKIKSDKYDLHKMIIFN